MTMTSHRSEPAISTQASVQGAEHSPEHRVSLTVHDLMQSVSDLIWLRHKHDTADHVIRNSEHIQAALGQLISLNDDLLNARIAAE